MAQPKKMTNYLTQFPTLTCLLKIKKQMHKVAQVMTEIKDKIHKKNKRKTMFRSSDLI